MIIKTGKYLSIISLLLISGCSTLNNYGQKSSVNIIDVNDHGGDIFNNQFEEKIKSNNIKQNIDLLMKIEANKKLVKQIEANKKSGSSYYSYYYSYVMLQHEILVQNKKHKLEIEKYEKLNAIDNKKEKAINDEIKFLLNACKTSSQDIADDLQNLAKNNPLHFQKIDKETDLLITNCLSKNITPKITEQKEDNKKVIIQKIVSPKKIVKKELVPVEKITKTKKKIVKSKIVKKETPKFNEEINQKYLELKDKFDHQFFSVKSHCNEEDSYFLPDDVSDFKYFIRSNSNNNEELSKYSYHQYEKEIFKCLEIYNSNTLLNGDN